VTGTSVRLILAYSCRLNIRINPDEIASMPRTASQLALRLPPGDRAGACSQSESPSSRRAGM
jgi:hypothetical protein